eukprot:scaffold199206_cov36-Prasinocladus_malaysianus.AAC.2
MSNTDKRIDVVCPAIKPPKLTSSACIALSRLEVQRDRRLHAHPADRSRGDWHSGKPMSSCLNDHHNDTMTLQTCIDPTTYRKSTACSYDIEKYRMPGPENWQSSRSALLEES